MKVQSVNWTSKAPRSRRIIPWNSKKIASRQMRKKKISSLAAETLRKAKAKWRRIMRNYWKNWSKLMQVAAMLCLLRLAPVQGRNKRSKNQRIAGCRYSHRKLKKGESIEEKITNRLMKMSLASSKMKMTIMKRKTMKMKIAMMMVMTMTTMMMNIVVKNRIIIERKRINLQERSSGN